MTHTRWMTATDLARHVGVDVDDLLEAHRLEEPCVHWHVRRRLVRSSEHFEGQKYLYRGVPIDEAPSQVATDKPQTKRRIRVPVAAAADIAKPTDDIPVVVAADIITKPADIIEPPRQTPDANVEKPDNDSWMRQDDLASSLGCATKTIRNSWAAGKRVKGYHIERRAIEAGEGGFGQSKFVFRRIESDAPEPVQEPINDGFVPLTDLAIELGVNVRSLRAGIVKGTYKGKVVKRRPVVPNEHADKRLKYVYRLEEAPAAQKPRVHKSDASSWMSVPELAKELGVTVSAIHGAWRQSSKVRGFRLERRMATVEEKAGRRIRFVFRTESDATPTEAPSAWMGIAEICAKLGVSRHSVYNGVKAGRIERRPRAAGDPGPRNAKFVFRSMAPQVIAKISPIEAATSKPASPAKTQTAAKALTVTDEGTEAPETSPMIAPSKSVPGTEVVESTEDLIQKAATYCLERPEHATAVFSFLKSQLLAPSNPPSF